VRHESGGLDGPELEVVPEVFVCLLTSFIVDIEDNSLGVAQRLVSSLARSKMSRFSGTFCVPHCDLPRCCCEPRTWPLFYILKVSTEP